jgi:hypothetical protein
MTSARVIYGGTTSPASPWKPGSRRSRAGWGPAGAGGGEPRAVRRTVPTRVVRQPPGPGRLAAAALVAALVAGGVALALRDGGGSVEPDRDEPPPATGTTTTDPLGVPTPQAYSQAADALEEAGSFAYRGVVYAVAGNAYLRLGWTSGKVTVEGAAVQGREPAVFAGREIAVDAAGRAFETVMAEGGAWSRAAPSRDGLAEARWDQHPQARFGGSSLPPSLIQTGENRVGQLGLTVALAIRSAGERRGDHPDAAGRRVVRATLPADHIGEPWAAADVLLTLDDGGRIARIAVASAPGHTRFEVELDIMRIGEPQDVVPPEFAVAATP